MYKDEIKKLKDHKQSYENIEIPEDLIDERILAGMKKGKSEEKPAFRINWLLAAAIVTVLLVGFVSTKHIIDYIRDNKGLMSAIEHDYYEEMGVSVKKEDIEFVVDGVIADEKGIVIFYTINSDDKHENIDIKEFHLSNEDDQEIKLGYASYGGDLFNNKSRKSFTGVIEAFYKNDNLSTDFNLHVEVEDRLTDGTFQNSNNQTFTIPLTIEKGISASKVYELNETVIIEGQKIMFQSALVSPLRTAIHVQMDPNNTKKLLQFDDLRIVDEHGETWGKITNGVTATQLSDDDHTIYLQSNYFKEPNELFLELNKIQAVDKVESKVIVDPVKEEIVKQPTSDVLKKFDVIGKDLVFEMDLDKDAEEITSIGFGEIFNNEGENLPYSANFYSQTDTKVKIGVSLDNVDDLKEPILLEIAYYPLWIKGDERIRLK